MGKNYWGKYFTQVKAAADQFSVVGSNVFYGRASVTEPTVVISTSIVKDDSVILVTMQSHITSYGVTNSYFRMPTYFVSSIYEGKSFTVSTVIESHAMFNPVTSYTCMWLIANPAA